MALLILRNLDGLELGRRPMEPSERYAFYQAWLTHELITWGQGQFVVHTVAWKIPAQECVCGVTFDSWVPGEASVEC